MYSTALNISPKILIDFYGLGSSSSVSACCLGVVDVPNSSGVKNCVRRVKMDLFLSNIKEESSLYSGLPIVLCPTSTAKTTSKMCCI